SPVWASNEYDVLNRVIINTAANGLVTTTAFSGLDQGGAVVKVVADPKKLARWSSSRFNMRKMVISSSDAKGSKSFTYDAGGRIESLTGPTNEKTTYTYDSFG